MQPANAIRINDTVFLGDCYKRTIDLLAKENFRVVPLPVTEMANLMQDFPACRSGGVLPERSTARLPKQYAPSWRGGGEIFDPI